MTADSLVARLSKLSASVVSDVLDNCGYPEQSLSSAIRPLTPAMRIAGPAVGFAGFDEARGDATPALSMSEIDSRLAAGDIAVIATNGHPVSAIMGGLTALSFANKGCGGMVSDGGVRDVADITAYNLPTFCSFTTPLSSARRWKLTAAGGTVSLPGQACANVTVATGDLLIGDADGVMVIPAAIAAEVIGFAEDLARIEAKIVAGLNAGEPREAVFAANPRFAHIRNLL